MKTHSCRLALTTFALFGLLSACTSGGTDGSVDRSDGAYTPDGDAGSVSIEIPEGDEVAVSDVVGFRVYVRNEDNQPVPSVPVTCDTEEGLALIEPTSGREITDDNGQMSGRIGCSISGSYQLACRAGGGNSGRTITTVRCTGERPSGFVGFPNAGGGGLGGGSVVPNSRLKISRITISDEGASGATTTSIDIVQSTCSSGTAESFYDTQATFRVVNDSVNTIRVTGLRYKITDAFGTGGSYSSPTIAVQGEVAPSGGELTFSAIIFDARSGTKGPFGTSQNFTDGFKTVTFTVVGEDEAGNDFTDTESVQLSFDGFNRCDASS